MAVSPRSYLTWAGGVMIFSVAYVEQVSEVSSVAAMEHPAHHAASSCGPEVVRGVGLMI